MKSEPRDSLYDLPLAEVRAHADHVIRALRIVKAHVADLPRQGTDASSSLATAVSTMEKILGAFMATPSTVLARTLAELRPRERGALRRALDDEKVARERLLRLLGEVPPSMVEDALAKIEVRERVLAELVAPWRSPRTGWPSPQC